MIPSTSVSRTPPMSLATTGRPTACASIDDVGNPSSRTEGRTATSKASSISAASLT